MPLFALPSVVQSLPSSSSTGKRETSLRTSRAHPPAELCSLFLPLRPSVRRRRLISVINAVAEVCKVVHAEGGAADGRALRHLKENGGSFVKMTRVPRRST